jgi:hypothetical protein
MLHDWPIGACHRCRPIGAALRSPRRTGLRLSRGAADQGRLGADEHRLAWADDWHGGRLNRTLPKPCRRIDWPARLASGVGRRLAWRRAEQDPAQAVPQDSLAGPAGVVGQLREGPAGSHAD